MNTRFTELRKASRTDMMRASSSGSKFWKTCRPPPVAKPSPGFAEYRRSIEASSIGRSPLVAGSAEILDGPGGELIALVHLDGAELVGAERREPGVEPGDHLKVADERAELGGGAEIEARPRIDVERLVEAVRLHAHAVGARRLLVEGEAVDHPRRVTPVVEEMEPLETEGLHDRGIAQRAQEPRHPFLRGLHERAVGGEIEPIEIVERGDAEQAREPGAHEVGALALGVVDRGQAPGPKLEALREGGVAQRGVDDARLSHEAQIAVGEVLERRPVLDEVVRGPPR